MYIELEMLIVDIIVHTDTFKATLCWNVLLQNLLRHNLLEGVLSAVAAAQRALFNQTKPHFRFASWDTCSLTHLCSCGDTWRGMIERCCARARKWRRLARQSDCRFSQVGETQRKSGKLQASHIFKIKGYSVASSCIIYIFFQSTWVGAIFKQTYLAVVLDRVFFSKQR